MIVCVKQKQMYVQYGSMQNDAEQLKQKTVFMHRTDGMAWFLSINQTHTQ